MLFFLLHHMTFTPFTEDELHFLWLKITAASAPNILPIVGLFVFCLPLFHCSKKTELVSAHFFYYKNPQQNTTTFFPRQITFSESTLLAISVKSNILTTLLLYSLIMMNPSIFKLIQRLISIKKVLDLTNIEAFLSLFIDVYFLQLNLIWLPADNRSFKTQLDKLTFQYHLNSPAKMLPKIMQTLLSTVLWVSVWL